MERISEYILGIIAAAMILGIMGRLLGDKNGISSLFQLIGGLFLVFTITAPVLEMDFSGIMGFLEAFTLEAEMAAMDGEEMAEKERRQIISDRTGAYILDKADELGVSLDVEVVLDAEGIPKSVFLTGHTPWSIRKELSQVISRELGIPEEAQQWNGQSE